MFKTIKLLVRFHFTDKPFDDPAQEPHFKIERLDFDLNKFNQQCESLGASKLTTVRYEDKQYPIYCLDVTSKKHDAKKLFVLAGTHGNEQGGLLGVEQILEDIEKNGVAYNVSVRIVAAHNPVGCDNFSRYNSQGIDVNRDFKKHQTAETIAVTKAFNDYGPDFCVSLHEGPQSGAFLYTNRDCDDSIIKNILNELRKEKVQLATKSYLHNNLAEPGQFPIKGVFRVLLNLWSGIFQFEAFGQFTTKKGVPSIVIETSWNSKSKEQRVMPHYILYKTLLMEL